MRQGLRGLPGHCCSAVRRASRAAAPLHASRLASAAALKRYGPAGVWCRPVGDRRGRAAARQAARRPALRWRSVRPRPRTAERRRPRGAPRPQRQLRHPRSLKQRRLWPEPRRAAVRQSRTARQPRRRAGRRRCARTHAAVRAAGRGLHAIPAAGGLGKGAVGVPRNVKHVSHVRAGVGRGLGQLGLRCSTSAHED